MSFVGSLHGGRTKNIAHVFFVYSFCMSRDSPWIQFCLLTLHVILLRMNLIEWSDIWLSIQQWTHVRFIFPLLVFHFITPNAKRSKTQPSKHSTTNTSHCQPTTNLEHWFKCCLFLLHVILLHRHGTLLSAMYFWCTFQSMVHFHFTRLNYRSISSHIQFH